MNLKIYKNQKLAKKEVYIGKSAQLRFKKDFVEEFKLRKGERFLMAIDEDDENTSCFYMSKVKNEDGGYKLSSANSTFHIRIKGFLDMTNIPYPQRCKYEKIFFDDRYWIKIILSKNPTEK